MDAALFCNATGKPIPKTIWKFKNYNVALNPFKYDIYSNMLIVKRFDMNDIGIYKCIAFNKKISENSKLNNVNNTSSINVTLLRAGNFNFLNLN